MSNEMSFIVPTAKLDDLLRVSSDCGLNSFITEIHRSEDQTDITLDIPDEALAIKTIMVFSDYEL